MSIERTDCWNHIGVSGDGTCPELVKVVHCHNCPVYTAGGRSLLEREPPVEYLHEWTQALAEEKDEDSAAETLSVLIFRLGREWLAMPTRVCQEMAEMRPIHTLPHRSGSVLLGLVNIRGVIRLCISLNELLGLELAADITPTTHYNAQSCLVVIARESEHWAMLVDEIYGIQRFPLSAILDAPVTVAKAMPRLTKGVIDWQDKGVGYLDDELLFLALRKDVL